MRANPLVLLLLAFELVPQPLPATDLELAAFDYRVIPNVVYRTLPGWSGRLDLYVPSDPADKPTLLWIHGGGWTRSSKEEELLYVLPYIAQGWSVAVIEYRLAGVAPAPAAVEDCRCALSWLIDNAAVHGISTRNVVVSGISAGGHLALTTGGLAPRIGPCPLPAGFRIAAVVNWFGPSDVVALAFGSAPFDQAVEWAAGKREVAEQVSPIRHVTADAPPVLTIHGTADDLIPYAQSVALHRQLSSRGVPNRLVTIPDAGHGDFTPAQVARSYEAIRSFLRGRFQHASD
jgi:acetyl esterase/lipase